MKYQQDSDAISGTLFQDSALLELLLKFNSHNLIFKSVFNLHQQKIFISSY